MKSKKILASMLVGTMILSITGCGSATEEINTLNNLESMGSESSVTDNYRLSYSEEQDYIYAQVANRTLLDLSTLDACTDNELQQAVAYMDTVDEILTGQTLAGQDTNIGIEGSDDGVTMSHFLTDYILTEFERTPYTWQRTQTIVRGIDSESRSIIVDVVYKTIGHEKDVKPDSSIVHGEPNYGKLEETRFDRYIGLLETEYNNPDDPNLTADWKRWKDTYGEPEDIIEEQQLNYPSERIFSTGIQQTYTGLIDNESEQSSGTMTIRYVLVPNYKLGINLGLTCDHLYITNYQLDNDVTEGMSVFTEEGYTTITEEVNSLIYSYFNCIDESDFSGLYKLTKNFGSLDKYYEDVALTTYSKHDNYTVTLFSVQGTHITCGITISSKVRARGSLMTYPIYTDRYFVEMDLEDKQLKVSNLTLISRTLEGEPSIKTEDADTTGFVAGVTIDNDDKLSIEDLICKFGALQLNGDTSSDDFGDVVDLSMSTSNLTTLKQNMMMLSGAKKVVWLQNYQQGSSNYASVRCREMFQDETNAIIEANTTYDFINKGGKWYIFKYDINSSVKTDSTNLSATGSLCLCTPGKVDAYTSQVKSTDSAESTVASDISVSYDHKEYTPERKVATTEQGRAKHKASEVPDIWASLSELSEYDYDTVASMTDAVADEGEKEAIQTLLTDSILLKANADDVLYESEGDFNIAKEDIETYFSECQDLYQSDETWAYMSNIIRLILRISVY